VTLCYCAPFACALQSRLSWEEGNRRQRQGRQQPFLPQLYGLQHSRCPSRSSNRPSPRTELFKKLQTWPPTGLLRTGGRAPLETIWWHALQWQCPAVCAAHMQCLLHAPLPARWAHPASGARTRMPVSQQRRCACLAQALAACGPPGCQVRRRGESESRLPVLTRLCGH